MIQDKDGDDSGAGVVIYIAKEPKVTGATENPQQCDIFTANMKEFLPSGPETGDDGDERDVTVAGKEARVVEARE